MNTPLLLSASLRYSAGASERASVSVRRSAVSQNPVAALVDIWTFCKQLEDYFERNETFGNRTQNALDVTRTLEEDISGIAKEIIRVVETSEFKLVETLAETLARIVVTDFGVAWVKLSVSKPGAIEGSRNVGVRIERTADDYA